MMESHMIPDAWLKKSAAQQGLAASFFFMKAICQACAGESGLAPF
jgi:hypothetical protein